MNDSNLNSGFYKSSDNDQDNTTVSLDQNNNQTIPQQSPLEFSWQDYEFPIKEKNFKWFLKIIVATIAVGLILYVLSQDYLTIIFLLIAVVGLIFYSTRKPKIVQFYVNKYQITVGKHQFNFSDYSAYFIKEYNNHYQIVLIPYKRFSPSVPINIGDQYYEDVLNIISQILPVGSEPFNMIDFIIDWFEI